MIEFVDVGPIQRAAPFRRQPHDQVRDWQAACERARGRRQANGLLRFVPCVVPIRPSPAQLGLARRGAILQFVRKGILTVGVPSPPGNDAA